MSKLVIVLFGIFVTHASASELKNWKSVDGALHFRSWPQPTQRGKIVEGKTYGVNADIQLPAGEDCMKHARIWADEVLNKFWALQSYVEGKIECSPGTLHPTVLVGPGPMTDVSAFEAFVAQLNSKPPVGPHQFEPATVLGIESLVVEGPKEELLMRVHEQHHIFPSLYAYVEKFLWIDQLLNTTQQASDLASFVRTEYDTKYDNYWERKYLETVKQGKYVGNGFTLEFALPGESRTVQIGWFGSWMICGNPDDPTQLCG